MQLLAGRVGLGLSMRGGDFFFEIGRASLALSGSLVPAHIRTHPLPAARTLVEVLLTFLHRRGESRIVRLAADRSRKQLHGDVDGKEKQRESYGRGPRLVAYRLNGSSAYGWKAEFCRE